MPLQYITLKVITRILLFQMPQFLRKICKFSKITVSFTCLNNIIVLVASVEFADEGELCDIATSFPCKVLAILLAVQV